MSAETIENGALALTKVDGRLPANPKLFSNYLASPGRKAAISATAASFMDTERLVKILLRCVAMNPQLQQCTMDSVFRSALMAAELGLELGSALGEAYLVPFKNTCQMIPGYRGLIALARRSGQVDDVYARAVFGGDEFEVSLGTEEYIRHTPKFASRNPNDLTYVYAVAKMNGGGNHFDIMTKAEVDAIRGRSPAGRSGPWQTDYIEMAKKTIVRRMCKMLPLSVEMAKAIVLDNAIESGDYSNVEFDCIEAGEVDPIQNIAPPVEAQSTDPPAKGSAALKDKLRGGEPGPSVEELAAKEQASREEAAAEKPALTGAQAHLAKQGGDSFGEAPDLELGVPLQKVPGAFA